ncbi:hypothetical protein POVWA1_028240 [Plasmodium ovale wallikeri]|uniref:Uncharacterized protein n=1 Tax=Plasmodium ovale wallikeri TaxID=864142 RepID=A0A1A8YVX0_PLAOA|nr:hypothetical protein POVWA1_028240 [Plasmodium ovale wallikeri]
MGRSYHKWEEVTTNGKKRPQMGRSYHKWEEVTTNGKKRPQIGISCYTCRRVKVSMSNNLVMFPARDIMFLPIFFFFKKGKKSLS